MVDLKYIGHSAFEFKTGDKSILVDPYVSIINLSWRTSILQASSSGLRGFFL